MTIMNHFLATPGWPLNTPEQPPALHEVESAGAFQRAMQAALRQRPRRISPAYLYDEAGSQLFESICYLPEYYVTQAELAVLSRHGSTIAGYIGPKAELIEFGAGSPRKLRVLLEELDRPKRYVPVDISGVYLQAEARALQHDYPWLKIDPVVADFTQDFDLGTSPVGTEKQVGLYFGSSIGNFDPDDARDFLKMAAHLLPGGAMLVGIDLVKDPAVLHAAYNDTAGVTGQFNRNLLTRANQELGANFKVDQFDHYAMYNPVWQRMEMHLVSRVRQEVELLGETYVFEQGETFHTESSYKFTLKGFAALATSAGWQVGPAWTDPHQWFALQWLYQDRRDRVGA